MRLTGTTYTRRDALSISSLALATLPILPPLPARSDTTVGGVSAVDAQNYQPPPEALGGLAPGTGRSLNALVKFRAETGIERTGSVADPLFKSGHRGGSKSWGASSRCHLAAELPSALDATS